MRQKTRLSAMRATHQLVKDHKAAEPAADLAEYRQSRFAILGPIATLHGMEQQAVIRRVRITVSVCFGVLTVALCVLWMRSYVRQDFVHCPMMHGARTLHLNSYQGRLSVAYEFPKQDSRGLFLPGWGVLSTPAREIAPQKTAPPQFDFESAQSELWILIPFWLPVALVGTLSVATGFRALHRFSHRTLLAITTLVAGALGLVAYTDR
jgi:hypothetical protein